MKIDARNITATLQGAVKFRAFLIYGENTGLVRERASYLVKKIAGTLDDPFQVAVLDKDGHGRFLEEATALSLMGGQRVVWVREAAENLTKSLESFCALYHPEDDPSSFETIIILEADNLSTRSSLRILAEKNPMIAAIPCYAETGRALDETIRQLLGKKMIAPDAFRSLLSFLGNDRALIRNEIEKLLLYVGQNHQITLDDIQQAIGDGGSFSIEDVIDAAMIGQIIGVDRALDRSMKEGVTTIAICRSLLYNTDRLLKARLLIEDGIPAKAAIGKLSPPVFFKRQDSFLKALDLWRIPQLIALLQHIQHLEYLCKQTAVPAELLCRQFLIVLTQQTKEKKTVLDADKLFSNW